MSDESRFDCRCKCPECVNARTVIRNLKKRMKDARALLTLEGRHASAVFALIDLRNPWPSKARTNYDAETP